MARPWVNRRHRWVLSALVGVGLAVWVVRPSPPPPAAPAPSPRASAPAPRPPPPMRPSSTTTTSAEPLVVRVVLPAVPTELSRAGCTGWQSDAWRQVPVAPEGWFARTAVRAAGAGEMHVPPRWVRAGLDAIGLAPGDLAGLANLDPWLGYAVLRVDHIWFLHDWNDELTDAAEARGTTVEALFEGASPERELRLAGLHARVADRQDAHRALLYRMADADDPTVRSVAVAMITAFDAPTSAERLLDPELADAARLALVDRSCGSPAGLGAEERDALRTLIHTTDDGEWAVSGAQVGLREAWADGDVAEIHAWAEDLAAARDRCLTWGPHGRFARDPRLSWDRAPSAARPEGFEAAARDFAQRTGMTLLETRCEPPPCVARFESRGPRRSDSAEAAEVWGPGGYGSVGSVGSGSDTVREVTVVAVDPEGGFTRAERSELAAARGSPGRQCLDEGQWSAVQAELADVVGPPQDWTGALRAAVFACHRDPGVGPSESVTVAGRWRGGWAFDPPGPLLDCVAERVQPPEPPAGTEITLQVSVPNPR